MQDVRDVSFPRRAFRGRLSLPRVSTNSLNVIANMSLSPSRVGREVTYVYRKVGRDVSRYVEGTPTGTDRAIDCANNKSRLWDTCEETTQDYHGMGE
jgi:hypothetical protein